MSEHDATGNGLSSRLDTIERRIDALREELGEVRAIARAGAVEPRRAAKGAVEQPPVDGASAPARPRVEPDAQRPSHPPIVVPPAQPAASPSRPTAGELIERWQLLGPRGFAIVGGAVTALGIGLLFVLAANRGWIGPAERVLLGAVASALVFGAGLLVRARYGQLLAALAAVGAGTAGAYATLAAASARYDLVPDALALPLAGAIAALTTAVALAWGSQILAGIGLVGSALAPALQAIDTGMTPAAAAFAVIVLAATAVIAAKRDWEPLLGDRRRDRRRADDRSHRRSGLGGGRRRRRGRACARGRPPGLGHSPPPRPRRDRPAPAGGDPAAGRDGNRHCSRRRELLAEGPDRGLVLLAAGGMWAGAWLALQGRDRSLALVVGTSSLALVAVATAELVSDDALTLAWAAQAILLSVLASRLRDARLQAGGLVYLALATGHALVVDAPPSMLFDPFRADAGASIALGAVALAALVAGVVAPARHVVATEAGVLAFLASVRTFLETHRTRISRRCSSSRPACSASSRAPCCSPASTSTRATSRPRRSPPRRAPPRSRSRRGGGRPRLIVASLVGLLVVLGESIYDVERARRGQRSVDRRPVDDLRGGRAARRRLRTPRPASDAAPARHRLGRRRHRGARMVDVRGRLPRARERGLRAERDVGGNRPTGRRGRLHGAGRLGLRLGRGSGTSRRPIGRLASSRCSQPRGSCCRTAVRSRPRRP